MQRSAWLLNSHKKLTKSIKARLREFKEVGNSGSDSRLFEELCFCILTPQSKAKNAWKAIEELKEDGTLYSGTAEEIAPKLKSKIRFHNQKAKRIVHAREQIFEKDGLKALLQGMSDWSNKEKREWFVQNIKGYGYKEAAHFLRNIGHYEEIAILDRHILKNLAKLKAIQEIPKSMTKKQYMDIEDKMYSYCSETGIPIEELDLVLWSEETGEIFK